MSTSVLPSLAGLDIAITREPQWDTIVQQSLSGKETRIAQQTYPRWKWSLTYNFLRSKNSFTELQQLTGFFNARQGQFDSFLYQDSDDNAVTGQQISTGDGTTTSFQMIRTYGSFIEPVLAPDIAGTIHIYLDDVLQASGYTVSAWGTSTPGMLVFNSAPGSGVAITADFSYYWPVRMDADNLSFNRFIPGFSEVKSFSFISVKN